MLCGAEIPRWIRKRLEVYQDDPLALQEFGHDVVANLCQQLLKRRSTWATFLHHESSGFNPAYLGICKKLGVKS